VLVLAAGAAAVWSVIDPSRAVWVAVSVLIVTCPCALSLAAPSALLAGAGAMARRGLLLRRLDAIEGLARMQALFVDKTGTLTESRLRCVALERLDGGEGYDDADLRERAASLAMWSLHPLSRALAEGCEAPRFSWRDVEEIPGQGLKGTDHDGCRWRLGSADWTGAGTDAGPVDAGASVWLSRCGRPRAVFRFDERVRDDAAAGVQALRHDGVRVILLSGDAPKRAMRLGAALGADASFGGMLPEHKLEAVSSAQNRGEVVAMLGDGINDAPVLAQADVSLAMGEGAFIARVGADGVLLSNRLQDVVQARALARRTMRVVRQNIAWAAGYNAACVPLALAGWLPPWAAGLGMATSSLAVILNSWRLGRSAGRTPG
jgi:Cu2+-exporting ATPase